MARIIDHRGDRAWLRKRAQEQSWTLIGDAATFEVLKKSGFLKPAVPEPADELAPLAEDSNPELT